MQEGEEGGEDGEGMSSEVWVAVLCRCRRE